MTDGLTDARLTPREIFFTENNVKLIIRTHTYTHKYIHTHKHTHTHKYTQAHTNACLNSYFICK